MKLSKNNTKRKKEEKGSILAKQVLEPLCAMLRAFEARLKPNQTLKERLRAYLDPQLELKWLEIFQKMIEDNQALLQRQMETNRSYEGQKTKPNGSEQVPRG